jgi:putative isomerase
MQKHSVSIVILVAALFAIPRATQARENDNCAEEQLVGHADWSALPARLETLNKDIASRGFHTFPGVQGKLITGYQYGEYYDWDLYFENIYLSYYGVSRYDLTNLKVFLDRQKQDGVISRTIGITSPKPKRMLKPFLAQLVVLAAKQNGNHYDWLREGYYVRLQRYLNRWFQYDSDHDVSESIGLLARILAM